MVRAQKLDKILNNNMTKGDKRGYRYMDKSTTPTGIVHMFIKPTVSDRSIKIVASTPKVKIRLLLCQAILVERKFHFLLLPLIALIRVYCHCLHVYFQLSTIILSMDISNQAMK